MLSEDGKVADWLLTKTASFEQIRGSFMIKQYKLCLEKLELPVLWSGLISFIHVLV